jgi:uncharacterized tellurite resistance protein B-like protein
MYKNLTREEKLAIIGVFKYVVNASGRVDEEEIEAMHSFIQDKSFNDFTEVLNEFEQDYNSIEDFYELLENVRDENKDLLIEEAYELAVSDGYASPEELEVFNIMSEVWNVDKDDLLDKISGS